MNSKHTPLPWHVARNDFGTWEIGLSEGYEDAGGGVCGCGENGEYLRVTVSGNNAEHDAEFIALACNSHDRVLEALMVADECLALIEDAGHAAMPHNVTVARGTIAAAVAKAKGAKP